MSTWSCLTSVWLWREKFSAPLSTAKPARSQKPKGICMPSLFPNARSGTAELVDAENVRGR
eukprot:4343797-Heterocapsa_arctica.AAC.1